ncbi:MAG: EF-hand domain-containing protein [Nitrospira sp.]|nr:EF-hand domain-containing protein [Nitrospira sp.]
MQISSVLSAGSLQQMQQMRQLQFSKADADGNGSLSISEFQAMAKDKPSGFQPPAGAPDPSEVFKKLDADGNGELTQTELANAPHPHFNAGGDQGLEGLLQSLQGSQTSLLDALFTQKDTDSAQTQDLSGSQDIGQLIKQYLTSYLSKTSEESSTTYQATV